MGYDRSSSHAKCDRCGREEGHYFSDIEGWASIDKDGCGWSCFSQDNETYCAGCVAYAIALSRDLARWKNPISVEQYNAEVIAKYGEPQS
jgi:hypothetical protein